MSVPTPPLAGGPVDPAPLPDPACESPGPRMRPVYECALPVPGERVLAVIEQRIKRKSGPVAGWVQAGQAELFLPDDLRFFSPALHLYAIERDGQPALRGRFAPLPQVWIVFVGVYFILAMIALGGLMWGISELVLGHRPWPFLAMPAAAALAGFVYGAAFIGQGLSAPQMFQLRSFVERSIEEAARSEEPPAA